MSRGKFIVLGGGDGTGKSTQCRLLAEYFKKRSIPCIQTREPGGSPYAEEIRRVILASDNAKYASGPVMFELFWAARVDHLQEVVAPAIESGKVVICDRFDEATFSYQIHGQEDGFLRELFFKKRKLYLGHFDAYPDLYVFLDIDPEKALRRISIRNEEPVNHFDERELNFHHRVREGCHEFAKLFPSVILDASGSKKDVHVRVLENVLKLIDE